MDFAPAAMVRAGLADAHVRPLVGVRTGDGVRSWRTSPDRAWGYPLLEWARTGNSYAALVLDCDSQESVERLIGSVLTAAPVPPPNVVAVRKASGHAQAAWLLKRPVHKAPGSRPRPLLRFTRAAEYYRQALGADAGFVGVLCSNPIHEDYSTFWERIGGYPLAELCEPIPHGWRRPFQPRTAEGRNCALFLHLCRWLAARPVSLSDLLDEAFTVYAGFPAAGHPFTVAEVRGIVTSVWRYRLKWNADGHDPAWLQRQRVRGEKSGRVRFAQGVDGAVRASASASGSNERLLPWDAEGVSRRTWYRHRAAGDGRDRGRPRLYAAGTEAWTVAGVSRATWYRQRETKT